MSKKLLDLTHKLFSIHDVDAQVCGNPSAGVCEEGLAVCLAPHPGNIKLNGWAN
jgi:hypothetical protein